METNSTQDKWDRRYRDGEGTPEPAAVLAENAHLLPLRGRALDLACGRGANAMLLARHGLNTVAWDQSSVAIRALSHRAAREGVEVAAAVRDVVAVPPSDDDFDVIVVAHFLERALSAHLIGALRPGGLLYYQTFVRDSVGQHGPSNPAYRLAENELLSLFVPPLRLRVYREEGTLGDTGAGSRDLAQMVAQKS